MKSIQNPRSEDEIFAELQALASKPGYAHVVAMLCFRDNAIGFAGKLNADDLAKMYSKERLIRTEISTLIGLLVKNDLNPNPAKPEPNRKREDGKLLNRTGPKAPYTSQRLEKGSGNFPSEIL